MNFIRSLINKLTVNPSFLGEFVYPFFTAKKISISHDGQTADQGLTTPLFIKFLRKARLIKSIYWRGNYSTWEQAVQASEGYDSEQILQKVKEALLKVKRGEAAYERDSVTFNRLEYDWPIIAALMWVTAQKKYLNVIDFGGSLGSTYFQNRSFLNTIDFQAWNIVEQAHFVKCGQENFQTDQLRFYENIDMCLSENAVNLLVLSSVLSYLEKPYEVLEKILTTGDYFVLIDKMPLIDSPSDRLTIQEIPASIYKASYPAWFFSRSKFYDFIKKYCEIVGDFDRQDSSNVSCEFKGFLLKKKFKT